MPNLRGDQSKRLFVEQNFISCTWHSVLPINARERCCCGNPLEQEVFLFDYVNKTAPDKKGKFFAGIHCAGKFQEFAHIKLPPLFNPFELDEVEQQNDRPNQEQANNNREHIINNGIPIIRKPSNKEFIIITNLLFYVWFPNIEGYLYDKRKRFFEHSQFSPNYSEYEKLYRAIQSTCKNNGVTTFHELLEIKGQQFQRRFRNYTFPITQQYFEEHFEKNVL